VNMLKKWWKSILLTSILLLTTSCGTGNQQGSLMPSRSAEYAKDDYKQMVDANNQLGFELLRRAEPNADGNSFLSPTSLFMALSMVFNGADGVTKEEMAKVLHSVGINAKDLNRANASLLSKLHSDSKAIQLKVANSIWLNEKYHFQKEFAKNNQDFFNAKIEEINIADTQSVKKINEWVEISTNGKIKEMVQSPLDPNLVTMLLNAIYFKGNWTYPFDKQLTEKRDFHMEDGTRKKVPFMMLNRELAYMENESFQAVSLPYSKGEMSMTVFLPREMVSRNTFVQLLSDDNWKKWGTTFYEKKGTVLLPKFQLEYEVLLNDTLKDLGMKTAFEGGANFSKMIEENESLSISRVKQKTFIEVNEKGTEAAAVTSVEVVKESASVEAPFYMEMNRPFYFVISDHETGAILFLGAVANP
jgi:serine protease inhibitor